MVYNLVSDIVIAEILSSKIDDFVGHKHITVFDRVVV